MNRIARGALQVAIWGFSLLGVLFVAIIIYYWPVIDRVVVRPCHHYPHAFADCKED